LQPRFEKAVDRHDQDNAEQDAARQALRKIRRVLGHRRNERTGLSAENDVQQCAEHDQEERGLDLDPAGATAGN
jgi:hypothetical protein